MEKCNATDIFFSEVVAGHLIVEEDFDIDELRQHIKVCNVCEVQVKRTMLILSELFYGSGPILTSLKDWE